jgi:hypothetical protein
MIGRLGVADPPGDLPEQVAPIFIRVIVFVSVAPCRCEPFP